MHHVGVALDHHLVGELHRADLGDTAHVVASQVDKHQVLGDFLGIRQQFRLQFPVLLLAVAATTGTGDGPHGDYSLFHPGQDLGGRAHDMEIFQVQVIHVGGGIEVAQGAVQVQGRRGEGDAHALGGHYLHHVPRQYVLLDPFDGLVVLGLGKIGLGQLFQLGAVGAAQHHLRQRRHGQGQSADQFPQTLLRLFQGAFRGRVGIDDQADSASQVVEYQHLLGHHQQDVRCPQAVGGRAVRQPGLDIAHAVITEITHQPAVKHRQVRPRRGVIALLELLGEAQRVRHLLAFGELSVHPHLGPVTEHLEHRATGQANNGITAPLLAALHRLEKVGVRAFRQFAVTAEGSFQVRQHLGGDRYAVVTLCRQCGKVLGIHSLSSENRFA